MDDFELEGRMAEIKANDNRDENGKYVKGKAAGPGRGYVSELRMALLAAVSCEDIYEVTRKLVEVAKEGDIDAISLLFNRALGKVPTTMSVQTDRNVSVSIQHLSNEELEQLERLALKAIPAQAKVIEDKR